jgi:hypothetical protein
MNTIKKSDKLQKRPVTTFCPHCRPQIEWKQKLGKRILKLNVGNPATAWSSEATAMKFYVM